MIHNWEIRIFAASDPTTQIGTLTPQSPITRDGLRMTLDPHGDCLEASWAGLNVELSAGRWIQHQDIIEIWTQKAALDVMVPRWSGYLVTVANRLSKNSQPFKAMGLKQKTKRHGSPFTFDSDIASTMFANAMGLMSPDWGFFVDGMNFSGGLTLPETLQNYQTSFEMFETWASAGGVVWGIAADRQAFAREVDPTALIITEGTLGTMITWEPSSGVDFVSKVIFLWFDSSDVLQGHIVTSPALLAQFGPSEHTIWLDQNATISQMEAWAEFFFRNGTETPSSVTVPELLDPKPTLEIIRPDSSAVTIPVEQVEYVISKKRNGITNIKAGRKLDPEQEITQSLIKARDQTSQDRAIRVSKGV